MNDNTHITQDTMFGGDAYCLQKKKGYRYSIDALLLAHFCAIHDHAAILDIGTGSGIIPVILMYRDGGKISQIDGLELQPSLLELARKNHSLNAITDKCKVMPGDIRNIRQYCSAESYSIVICNPPFYADKTGRVSMDEEARSARHQLHGNITDFVKGAAYCVRNKGAVCFIYPAEQVVELFGSFAGCNLEIKRVRFVYSYPAAKSAKLVLVEGRKNGGPGVEVLAPLCIYEGKNGRYTKEIEEMYAPNSTSSRNNKTGTPETSGE